MLRTITSWRETSRPEGRDAGRGGRCQRPGRGGRRGRGHARGLEAILLRDRATALADNPPIAGTAVFANRTGHSITIQAAHTAASGGSGLRGLTFADTRCPEHLYLCGLTTAPEV